MKIHEAAVLNTENGSKDYFIIIPTGLLMQTRSVAKLDPRRLLIPQRSIDILSNDLMFRKSKIYLNDYIDHLVDNGAKIVPLRKNYSWFDTFVGYLATGSSIFTLADNAVYDVLNSSDYKEGRFFIVGHNFLETYAISNPKIVKFNNWKRGLNDADEDLFTLSLGDSYYLAAFNNASKTYLSLCFSLIVSIFIVFIANLILDFAIKTDIRFPSFAVLITIALAGTALYAWRERWRLSYGISELLVGVTASYKVFADQNILERFVDQVAYLQLIAGLYIMVRGFDNIAKGLEPTPLGPKWKRFFERSAKKSLPRLSGEPD